MSRLNEMEEMEITRRIQRLEARLIELKSTPQLTSNRSGVKNYQVPELDNWQVVEWTDYLDNTIDTVDMVLPPLPNNYSLNRIEVVCEYTPLNQNNPIVYPYLTLQIDGAEWSPSYSPGLGLGFSGFSGQAGVSTYTGFLTDNTDYSEDKPVYKYGMTAYYSTTSSTFSPTLRAKFRLRSTDRGSVKVKIKTYKDF